MTSSIASAIKLAYWSLTQFEAKHQVHGRLQLQISIYQDSLNSLVVYTLMQCRVFEK